MLRDGTNGHGLFARMSLPFVGGPSFTYEIAEAVRDALGSASRGRVRAAEGRSS